MSTNEQPNARDELSKKITRKKVASAELSNEIEREKAALALMREYDVERLGDIKNWQTLLAARLKALGL